MSTACQISVTYVSAQSVTHVPGLYTLPGETFTVTAWYRTQESDDEVHVTIDFRDQEMWTPRSIRGRNPLASPATRMKDGAN
jgi:hypothetical protein